MFARHGSGRYISSLQSRRGRIELTNDVDLELLPLQRAATDSSWVGIADARRYQQDTYTTIVRRTRGPNTERLGLRSRV
jgi:hypothetical protein